MILIKEIDKEPESQDAEESRNIVDEALALCSPAGGLIGIDDDEMAARPLTEGGREAWELIRRLRSQAWQKCGVDPDVLYTREQVTERAREKATHSIAFPDNGEPDRQRETQAFVEQREAGEQIQQSNEPLVPSGEPTPNIDWAEWDAIFGGQEGGNFSSLFES